MTHWYKWKLPLGVHVQKQGLEIKFTIIQALGTDTAKSKSFPLQIPESIASAAVYILSSH